MQALSCLVRILRALVEWYLQTAAHAAPAPADPEAALALVAGGEAQLLAGRDSWGQLQSLKRGTDDSTENGPGDVGRRTLDH